MNVTRIAESRAKHMKLLSDALVLQIEMKRAQLISNGVDEDKLQDEISVLLMADLQEKQTTESNAVGNVLGDKVSQVEMRPREISGEIPNAIPYLEMSCCIICLVCSLCSPPEMFL